MSLIMFANKVVEKLGTEWRRSLLRAKAKKCGTNCNVYGKIYHINPNVVFGDDVHIYPGVQFFGDGEIIVGNNVHIGNDTLIYASKAEGITIGDNTQIAAHSYIIDCNHGTKGDRLIMEQKNECAPIHIGSDVWLGANVVVIKGANISDGAIIGAMALVNSNIEEKGIAVGIPAKVIKYRKE